MNLDYSCEPTSVAILKLFLFSTYNTLKCVLFIVLNIGHNNRCKREISRMALENAYVTFSTYNTLKYVLFIRMNIIHNSTCKQEMREMCFEGAIMLWGILHENNLLCY